MSSRSDSEDPFARIHWFIVQVLLLILLIIGAVKLVKTELAGLFGG